MAALNGSSNGSVNGSTKHPTGAPADGPTDAYKLPRDASESQRLDAQHVALRTNVGFLLHPCIVDALPKVGPVKIADLGTGTGAWLLELAEEMKDARITYTGLDISDAQFPAAPPSGVSFKTYDMLSPVPAQFLSAFDVVHVRFLVLGLPSGTWPQALANLTSMLKPGGWIQWMEPDFRTTILSLVAHGTQHHNLAFHDSESLASHFAAADLKDVTETAFASDRVPETRLAISRVFEGGITGLQRMICAGDAEEQRGRWGDEGKGRKVLSEVGEACERGEAYWRLELNVFTGRKGGA
ncbi:hypothetical protein B0A48_03131 [Cryoendolithus antarcticus]|uniref:Methyltransferase domain-containing protein n=1 Tax=Cryoendolithus antarcticus TaxID=1507870 RepID=A0A1V8TM79_9PEZI|nr:hypothetical protein B0A48_03131 [Cryoendolithus antarcticus]